MIKNEIITDTEIHGTPLCGEKGRGRKCINKKRKRDEAEGGNGRNKKERGSESKKRRKEEKEEKGEEKEGEGEKIVSHNGSNTCRLLVHVHVRVYLNLF